MRKYTVCGIETPEDLWDLRNHTPIGSLFLADYRYADNYGLDREAACDLFDAYFEEFRYKNQDKLNELYDKMPNWRRYEEQEDRLFCEWQEQEGKETLWCLFLDLYFSENECEPPETEKEN